MIMLAILFNLNYQKNYQKNIRFIIFIIKMIMVQKQIKNNKSNNLFIKGIGQKIIYDKNNFITRFFKDIKYGKEVAKQISEINPDVVISGNCPTLSQQFIIK